MTQRPRVTVLGSLNTDISLPVPHLPGPGETVLAREPAVTGAGGKGANQAVAAARLGAAVRMVGCCGDDAFGTGLRNALIAEGVDTAGVRTVAGIASGLALITVDPAGENAIAVALGANGHVGGAEAAAAFAAPSDVLALSAEIPPGTLAAAMRRAERERVPVVLNLAPVPEGAVELLAAGADWLVVNAPEAGALTGRDVAGVDGARAAARWLAAHQGRAAQGETGAPRPRYVVITVGAAGAVLAGPGTVSAVPGFSVASVDTVGAGDAFVGALAVALACGIAPEEAVRGACAAGAAATTRRGAQTALPRPADVLAATGYAWPGPG